MERLGRGWLVRRLARQRRWRGPVIRQLRRRRFLRDVDRLHHRLPPRGPDRPFDLRRGRLVTRFASPVVPDSPRRGPFVSGLRGLCRVTPNVFTLRVLTAALAENVSLLLASACLTR